jgi:hypothetical protein
MGILRAESKRKGYKLIGVTVPSYIFEYLTLYILAKETTKAKVLKDIVDKWIKSQRQIDTDQILIKDIVIKLNMQRKINRANGVHQSIEDYKKIVEEELLRKGLKGSYIQLIIAELDA